MKLKMGFIYTTFIPGVDANKGGIKTKRTVILIFTCMIMLTGIGCSNIDEANADVSEETTGGTKEYAEENVKENASEEPRDAEFNLFLYNGEFREGVSVKYFLERDVFFGPTLTVEDAKVNAEKIWIEVFGEEDALFQKPYTVWYDEIDGYWFIRGNLPDDYLGGEPYAVINKTDGELLGIWHTE